MLRNSQVGAYVYPVVPAEYSNWRDEQRAWRDSCVLFDQSHHMVEQLRRRPGCPEAVLVSGDQQLRELPGGSGQAVRSLQLRRLRHRRRHPVPPGREQPGVRRPRAVGELDSVPRRDRRLQRQDLEGRPLARPHRGQGRHPQALPLPDSGTERRQADREAERRPDSRHQVLQHGRRSTSPAARCARCVTAWPARPVSRSGDPYEEGEEIRAAIVEAGKDFGLVQVGSRAYATNTLESGWIPSPLPAVYTGEKHEEVPRVAAGGELRGHRVARRQLRLEQHRGLLRDAVRAGLRHLRQVRPRLHRPRSAREDRAASRTAGR